MALVEKNRDLQDFVVLMLKILAALGVAVMYLTLMLILLVKLPLLFAVVLIASIVGLVVWLKK